MQRDSPKIRIFLPLKNRVVNEFKNFSLESDYTKSCDSFSIEIASNDPKQLVGLEAQPIEISINGNPMMVGRVDKTTISDNVSLQMEGRDYIADMVECNIDPLVKLQEGMTLRDAITYAASPVGIKTVASADEVELRNIKTGANLGSPPRPEAMKTKLGSNKPDPGKGIYQFLNELCIRAGCTIQPTPNDRTKVVVSEPDYEQPPAYTIKRSIGKKSSENNILTATVTRDLSSFPTHVLTSALASPMGVKVSQDFKPASFAVENPFDSTVFDDQPEVVAICANDRIKPGTYGPEFDEFATGALYRLLYLRDKKSKDAHAVENKAVRLMADKLKDTLVYTATVQGLTTLDGKVYAIDTVVQVQDEVTQVFEQLWICGVTYSYSERQGFTTELRCWRKGAFGIGTVSVDS